jgi:hypothetical protein
MPLQKINWTQIDSAHVPTGNTVDIGQFGTGTSLNSVNTNNLSILGIDFFDYLKSAGFTGVTPNDVYVDENGGLSIRQEYFGKVLSTTYNTALNPDLPSPATVGGIVSGTTVSQLTGKTFVEFVDELLFPTVLPTYTPPTISISGVLSGVREAGSTLSTTIGAIGTKNDAGAFTQLRILRNATPIWSDTSLLAQPTSNIPDQFGYVNPNNPNYQYVTDGAPYVENFIIPWPSGLKTITLYNVDGNYNAGLSIKDSKGITDVRTPLIRSVNAPQALSNYFTSSTVSIEGIYPYFYGTSLTLPTTASIAAAIAGGTATKVLESAENDLVIPYNIYGQFIWVAYFNNNTTKTKWYVSSFDNSDIDNSFISTVSTALVNSPDLYWSGVTFKMHWSVYATIQDTFEFRNV